MLKSRRPASSAFQRFSDAQRFSVSAFQRFSVSAFQRLKNSAIPPIVDFEN
jgi:hypothetical protein